MRLKASPAAFVYAPDEKSALKKAIEEFEIRREDQKRLLVLLIALRTSGYSLLEVSASTNSAIAFSAVSFFELIHLHYGKGFRGIVLRADPHFSVLIDPEL